MVMIRDMAWFNLFVILMKVTLIPGDPLLPKQVPMFVRQIQLGLLPL